MFGDHMLKNTSKMWIFKVLFCGLLFVVVTSNAKAIIPENATTFKELGFPKEINVSEPWYEFSFNLSTPSTGAITLSLQYSRSYPTNLEVYINGLLAKEEFLKLGNNKTITFSISEAWVVEGENQFVLKFVDHYYYTNQRFYKKFNEAPMKVNSSSYIAYSPKSLPKNALTFKELELSGTYSAHRYSFELNFDVVMEKPEDVKFYVGYSRKAPTSVAVYINNNLAEKIVLEEGTDKHESLIIKKYWFTNKTNHVVLEFVDYDFAANKNEYQIFSKKPISIAPYSYIAGEKYEKNIFTPTPKPTATAITPTPTATLTSTPALTPTPKTPGFLVVTTILGILGAIALKRIKS